MSISKILHETTDACTLIELFVIAPEAYGNLINQKDAAIKYPVHLVYDTKITGLVGSNQMLQPPTYNITSLIATTFEYSNDGEDIEAVMNDMSAAAFQFIATLLKHPKIDNERGIENINLYRAIHIFDDNLVGWVLNYNLTTTEAITPICSAVTENPDYE